MVYLCTRNCELRRPDPYLYSSCVARGPKSARRFSAGTSPFASCGTTKDEEDFMPGYKSIDRIRTVTASTLTGWY